VPAAFAAFIQSVKLKERAVCAVAPAERSARYSLAALRALGTLGFVGLYD
jgi:hypothetical protein